MTTNRHISRYSCVLATLLTLPVFAPGQHPAAAPHLPHQPTQARTAAAATAPPSFKVDDSTDVTNVTSLAKSLEGLLVVSRTACKAAQKLTNGKENDPQYKSLKDATTSLDSSSIGPLAFQGDTGSFTLSIHNVCAGTEPIVSFADISTPGSQLTISGATQRQFASSMKIFAANVHKFVEAGFAFVSNPPSGITASNTAELQGDLHNIADPWEQLKKVVSDLKSSDATKAMAFDFGGGLKFPSTPTPKDKTGSVPSEQNAGNPGSGSTVVGTVGGANNNPPKHPFSLAAGAILFDVILFVLLIFILLKVRDSKVLQLSGTQEQALASATESVNSLSTRVSGLNQQVQTLMAALTIYEQEEKKRAQASSQASQASVDAAVEARRQAAASTPASSSGPPIVRASRDDPSPATFNPPFDESSSGVDSEQNFPAGTGFAAAEPAPDPDAPSLDPVTDYNRARSMGADGESWFRSHYSPTDLTCENLDALKASKSAQVRFVRHPRGSFLAVRSVGDGDSYLAFPAFAFDPGSSREEFNGVFNYGGSGGSKSRLNRAATLQQRGDTWLLDDPGDIQNG